MKRFSAVSVVVEMVMTICFGTALFSFFLHVWELPEFMPLMARDRSKWPHLLWHGWLPGLRMAGERDPWVTSLCQLADGSLEQAVDDSDFRTPPDFGDTEDLATEIGEHPCVWSDGS